MHSPPAGTEHIAQRFKKTKVKAWVLMGCVSDSASSFIMSFFVFFWNMWIEPDLYWTRVVVLNFFGCCGPLLEPDKKSCTCAFFFFPHPVSGGMKIS